MGPDDAERRETPTRREYVKYGGALVGGGLFAGCTGRPGDESDATATVTASDAAASDDTPQQPETETPDESYSVELSPVGTVTLEEPPTNVFTHFPWFPDMASCLGRGATVNNLWWDGTVAGLEYFTAEFDEFEIEWADRAGAYGFTKEQVYELDSDLHLVDPAWVTSQDEWTRADVDEVTENVGPWLGNYYSGYHATPPEEWADGYEYYSLWELFDRVATLYDERSRYEALRSVHDDLLATIEADLPPVGDRPSRTSQSRRTSRPSTCSV